MNKRSSVRRPTPKRRDKLDRFRSRWASEHTPSHRHRSRVGGKRKHERGYRRDIHLIQKQVHQGVMHWHAGIERPVFDDTQNQFPKQRRYRENPAVLETQRRRLERRPKVERPDRNLSPHANPVAASCGNEYRFAGRNHPGRPAGVYGHRSRASVSKLMPIMRVHFDDVAAAAFSCRGADGQERFLF